MMIKKKMLVMNNVISVQKVVMNSQEIDKVAFDLRRAVISKGLYPTGPIVYQQRQLEGGTYEYTLYVSVNQPIEIKEEGNIKFIPRLEITQGLCMRHMSMDDDVTREYLLLEECAKRNHMELEKPYYQICMNVYGETIIDVFVPISGENNNDNEL